MVGFPDVSWWVWSLVVAAGGLFSVSLLLWLHERGIYPLCEITRIVRLPKADGAEIGAVEVMSPAEAYWVQKGNAHDVWSAPLDDGMGNFLVDLPCPYMVNGITYTQIRISQSRLGESWVST